MQLILAGYVGRDSSKPAWIPDGAFDNIDNAINDAYVWIAGRADARVDIAQLENRTGRVVVSVTADGVERVAPIHRDHTTEDAEPLRRARSHDTVVNGVEINRLPRSTRMTTMRPGIDLVRSLNDAFGTELSWSTANEAGLTSMFRHTSGEFVGHRRPRPWHGVNATGVVRTDGPYTTLAMSYRPTRGSVLTFIVLLLLIVAIVVTNTFEDGWMLRVWSIVLMVIFAGLLVACIQTVRKHRLQSDLRFFDAVSVTS
jgi:hypothetical protein